MCAILLAAICSKAHGALTYDPPNGFVPDADTAIKIAVAVWEPIYGAKQIAGEAPYHATLRGSIWYVCGSLPEGMLGGVATAQIARKNGRIIKVIHGQ